MASNPYQKVNAYGKNMNVPPQNISSDSREIDARALLTCAARLNGAKELMEGDQKSKENMKIYGDAVRNNQRLWTIFQVALTDPENSLPMPLKINLMTLGRYVDKTSFAAVGKYAPKLIDSLININRIIASGLTKKQSGDAVPSSVSEASNMQDGSSMASSQSLLTSV